MKIRQLVVWSLVGLLLLWPGLSWAQQPKPGGTLRIALPGDPAFYNAHQGPAMGAQAFWTSNNIYNSLLATTPPPELKIVPELAESFEQSKTDPKTWRFKLRQGLKFINGEPFTSDGVVAVVNSIVDPKAPGQGIDEFGLSGGKVTKIDDYTVDITTAEADAIFPARLVRLGIPAPKWLASMPNDASITQAVGIQFGSGDFTITPSASLVWGRAEHTSYGAQFGPASRTFGTVAISVGYRDAGWHSARRPTTPP